MFLLTQQTAIDSLKCINRLVGTMKTESAVSDVVT